MFVPKCSELETFSDHALTIRTLGVVGIELRLAPSDNAPTATSAHRLVKVETRTIEALLIYLACQGRPVSRDLLAELLWPERSQKQARANLRLALHRLRRQVDPFLLVTRQSVGLNPNASIDLDAARFETHLAEGQLDQATDFYRGDFLADFYLDDSPAFEQWALLERERLRTLALAAWQQQIEQLAATGQLQAAIDGAQRLLQLDPLHEPTHRQLMRLLTRTGHRSAALAQYESCRHLLATELDAPPDEATMALAERIRSGELDKVAGREGDKVVSLSSHLPSLPPPHNLPPQSTPLIGRSVELTQIAQLLANPDCRLLTLLGVGGIGKTRLALECATRQAGKFSDGVYFVGLAPLEESELVTAAIARSLGLQNSSGDLLTQVAAYLQPRALLLILDNFEQIADGAETIAQLLHRAPRLKVLVTSRQRLALLEEWLLPVGGLSSQGGWLDEAGQLFLCSAQRVQPGFTVQGQEETIAAICRQVEGMPLALELAASWVRVMPCSEIVRLIQVDIDFLTTPLRNLPERHRSLRALFDQSWRLLAPVEQGVLMRLSVFRGGWQLAEAAAVTGATLALLLGLVDKSLVRANGQRHFDLHELVRQYAAEQLLVSGEGALIRQRHYAAYLQLFRMGDGYLRGPEAPTWVTRLGAEQDNLRAALQWTLDEARYSDMQWLLIASTWYWVITGKWYEFGRWPTQLLPYRHLLPPSLRLVMLINMYAFARAVEEFQPSNRFNDEMIQLMEICPHLILHAVAWHFIAAYYSDFSQAAAARERAIAAARLAREKPTLGPEHGLVSDCDFTLGMALWAFAYELVERGFFDRATPLLHECQEIFRQRENHYLMIGLFQPALAIVTFYHGDTQAAKRLLHDSLRLCIELKDKRFLAQITLYLAEIALSEGDVEQSEQQLRLSLSYHSAIQNKTIDQVTFFFIAACLATAQQQYRRAATLFGLAEQAHSQIHYVIGGPMRARAETALATVQAALEPAAFAGAFAAGQQMTLEQAFATLLAPTFNPPLCP